MKSFVAQKNAADRPTSPEGQRLRTTSRGAIAEQAKVPVTQTQMNRSARTNYSMQQPVQGKHDNSMGPPLSTGVRQEKQDLVYETAAEHHGRTRDGLLDTDTENFEASTRTSQILVDQGEDYSTRDGDNQDEDDTESEGSGEEAEEKEKQEQYREAAAHATRITGLDHLQMLQVQNSFVEMANDQHPPGAQPNFRASGMSYPTTTSGHIDEDDPADPVPDVQQEYAYQSSAQGAQPRFRPIQPQATQGFMATNQPAQGAVDRRHGNGIASRQQTKSVPNDAMKRSELPPIFVRSQSALAAQTPGPDAARIQEANRPAQTRRQRPPQQTRRADRTVPMVAEPGAPVSNIPTRALEHEEEREEPEPEILMDYDAETIRQMRYKDLDQESFDHNPRPTPSVLTDEQAALPLPERLTLLQSAENRKDKASFFASLNIDEWEEAGDWFLGRFGDLLGKMKQARQNKRKVAREFEDEIRDRDAKVAGKRRCVEDAMSTMKSQGQGLIVGSPRKRGASAE